MWSKVASIVIRYRLSLLIALGFITAYMGWMARNTEISYDYLNILPYDDEDLTYFDSFKAQFGEDGNIIAVGLKDKKIHDLETFNKYRALIDELSKKEGVNSIISLPEMMIISKDTTNERFGLTKLFPAEVKTQKELDSLFTATKSQKLYSSQIYNSSNDALLFAVAVNKEVLRTAKRQKVVLGIVDICRKFEAKTGLKLHYAGIPYVRATMVYEVNKEIRVFLALSFIISALVLFIFFRSWESIFVPMVMVGINVIWVFGTIGLFGYKISILTGLTPTLIVISGIPNFIYLINKYHQEYQRSRNKIKSIANVIKSIGVVTFLTTATTAVGFLVLCTNHVTLLREFGLVAGINIMASFFISIIIVPAVLVYMKPPTDKQMRHLNKHYLTGLLDGIVDLTYHKRGLVYIAYLLLSIVGIYGITKIKTVSYMLDDIPEKLTLKEDMRFFESNFKGIMPLEFVIDTHKKKAIMKPAVLKKVSEFEEYLASLPSITTPVSVNSFMKGAVQAYYNGDSTQYRLPEGMERSFILRYLGNTGKGSGNEQTKGLLHSFIDSSQSKFRISCKVADMGSVKLDTLLNDEIKPKIKEIFGESGYDVKVTGTTLLFMRGNSMLINSLNSSIVQSILCNALIMAVLFSSFRMIIISLIPNFIPLIVTAAIMGFFGIPLKPSTAIIFSIVFGITVDNTIHFLAKYRYEIFHHKLPVKDALTLSILDAGPSMIYTTIVLFFGFIIFTASNFGGTIALGVLTSITLMVALVTNLTILPALIMSFDRGRKEQDFDPIFEHYEDFYFEEDDENLDLDLLEVAEEFRAEDEANKPEEDSTLPQE